MFRQDSLLVALGVGRACVQCAEVATLPSEDLLCRLFVCVESGGEIFLLLLNVVERLVDIVLLLLSRDDEIIQRSKLTRQGCMSVWGRDANPTCARCYHSR